MGNLVQHLSLWSMAKKQRILSHQRALALYLAVALVSALFSLTSQTSFIQSVFFHIGYDVQFLATPSRHMIGLDMSKTALDVCIQKHPNAKALNYEFVLGDFFKTSPPEQGYDLAYDYT